MAGIPISGFLDWQIDTGPQFLSGPNKIIQSVSRRSFIMGKFMRGKKPSRILQGSDKIQEVLYLDANRTFQVFERGDDIQWVNPQKDVLMSLDFKFMLDHMTWDEWEYLGQTAGLSGDGLRAKYKDMRDSKMQRLWESFVDGYEDRLWLPPNSAATYASMESGGPDLYSIPVFVNEGGSSVIGFDANWVTVEGVDMTSGAGANFDNARVQYDAVDLSDTDNDNDGLFNAFDDISVQIQYKTPGFKDTYFEDEVSMGTDVCIACSKAGYIQIMSMHRKSNDMLITPQDAAYPMPRWNGAPIADVQALDSALLYAGDSSTYVGEKAATVTASGPRYYFLNVVYLNTIFHRAKYFSMGKVKEPVNKQGVYIIPVECWGNLTCTSRRHQGIVYPQ